MATRGIRILMTLPLVIALFVAAAWFAVEQGFSRVVTSSPDQVVSTFLYEITSGQAADAVRYLGPAQSRLELAALGSRLVQRNGPIMLNESDVRQWTPDTAIVWSRTETSQGNVYFLTWVLARQGDRWVIQEIQGLKEIVPDMPGL